MAHQIMLAVIVLGALGIIFAVVLYFVAQKFKVIEDPLIDEIAEVLPGANCGGCGKAGCRAMAEAFVKQGNMEGLKCPAGGDAVMQKVAALLGCVAEASEPQVAVVRCNACFTGERTKVHYDGLRDCSFANSLFTGENGCQFGCLGLGNCAAACQFDALVMDPETGAPKIDEEKCTACGACVKACPRGIIELRNKGRKNRRVFVNCVNKEKGAVARKTCDNACIGCGKCTKVCPKEAIKVENNLAYVDYNLCIACGKCVNECPTGALVAVNFTPVKPKPAEAPAVEAPKTEAPKVEINIPQPEPVEVKKTNE
ncbi:MAG: RnfABCDGE type electron transport complex subunit B [Bacteroidales bacterium]|nr:RnfABCDGE type electron transport complex subunit B [Bacteroidales bacterium]